jgi:hypothetical protein
MKPSENPAYVTTADILRISGYAPIRSFSATKQFGYANPESRFCRFEIWGGPKGTLILQIWKDGNGVSAYADWPLGHTFTELEKAL